jgi:hypothetical protein
MNSSSPQAVFQFAVNKHGRNKDWNYEVLNSRFENTQGTLQNLIDVVSQGYAITAATFKPGTRRAKANVAGAELWLLDIDNSGVLQDEAGKSVKDAAGKAIKVYSPQLTIEEAQNHPFIQKYCLLAYTSASHKPDWHKFRLILRLPRFIEGVTLVEATARRLMEHLPHDPACKDASRVFYGNTNADFFIINPDAQCLPEEWLTEASVAVHQQKIEEQQRSQQRLKWIELQDTTDVGSLVKDALSYIPPRSPGSGNYQECLTVLMALQSHYGWEAETIAEAWSPSIRGTTWNIGRKLRSFNTSRAGEVTLGSLFHIAKQYGFRFPETKPEYQTSFGGPDRDVYERYLEQERRWQEAEEQEAVEAKNEWFRGFCRKVKQRFFTPKAAKEKTQSAKDATQKTIVQFSPDKPLPQYEDYQSSEKEPPLVRYAKAERHAAWLSARAAGWQFIQDRSAPGLGKSYDAGLLFPNEADVSDDSEKPSSTIWYLAGNHTNPPTETVERMANLMPRHQGMVVDPNKKTPLGGPWLKHSTHDDKQGSKTVSNCRHADLFSSLANKNYDVHGERVLVSAPGEDKKDNQLNPVCAACSENWHCHRETGDGYGYKLQRGHTLSERRIRAHLDSIPLPVGENGHNYSRDIAVVEEAGVSLRAVKTVATDLGELAAEWAFVEEDCLEAFEQLREFRLSLNRVLQGEANNDPRFGANHQAIAAFLPPVPDNIRELIEQVRAALPQVSDLFESSDSIQGLGGDLKKAGNFIRSKLRQQARADFAAKAYGLPTAALLNILKIWGGEQQGAMRCNNGVLNLTLPDSRHSETLGSCDFVVMLDATVDKVQLASKLGINPNAILELEQETQPLKNLTVVNINAAGLGSADISDTAKQRVLALVEHLNEKHQSQIPVIALKRDQDWLKELQSGHWFNDSRGSNAFRGEQVMISVNTPRINVGAVRDEYLCLHGSLDNFDEYYQKLIQVEQAQCIGGRQRAGLEPQKQFIHYSIGTNQNLDFLAQEYGCTVENVEAIEVCIEAGTRGQQSKLRILEAATELLDAGSKLTQAAIGELSGMSQAGISKIASRFGSWKTLKKILLSLIGANRVGYIFGREKDSPPPDLSDLSEEERLWATEFLPGVAESVTGEDLADAVAQVSQVYGAQSLERILHFTPHWVKAKLLVAVLCILPPWARNEFLASTNLGVDILPGVNAWES